MNAVMQAMRNHRSIRKFTPEPIAPETLQALIRSGQAAPSSSFIQAYSVIRVSNPEHRARISEVAGGQPWIREAAEFLVYCADLYRINYLCEQQGMGTLTGRTEHFLAASVDVALMAQNVLLAAESIGLGGVFIGGIRNDPARVSELLELPERVYPVFGMCLGHPAQEIEVKPRLPVEVILHEGRYQQERVPAQVAAYDAAMADYYQARSSNRKLSDWSAQTAAAIQKKQREHMLSFLQARGFLKC
ncbi:MAG: oxygen-insensitive NADPH nitroreductase [Thiothrix sp.]|nr:oxygen-insensitive NADPH nitroreductase [Thiothrix sp.]HPE61186.1 oxygen-insensitive NADPH nitroreductase [Thiolinea sp.]